MTVNAATPYLILNGQAEAAVEHYKAVLGATVEDFRRMGDMQPGMPEPMRSRVMHAALRVGTAAIMLSDGAMEEATIGRNVQVALMPDDPAEARRMFDGLAAGGTTVQPLMDAPWGGMFGALIDKFGVSWMFNVTPAAH